MVPSPPPTAPRDPRRQFHSEYDLEVGQIVYMVAKGEPHGANPAIVRSWRRITSSSSSSTTDLLVSIIPCTSFGGRSIRDKPFTSGDQLGVRGCLAIAAATAMYVVPHAPGLPVLHLRDGDGAAAPLAPRKQTYANCDAELEVALGAVEKRSAAGRAADVSGPSCVVENMDVLEAHVAARKAELESHRRRALVKLIEQLTLEGAKVSGDDGASSGSSY